MDQEIQIAYIKENKLAFSEIDKFLEPLLHKIISSDSAKTSKATLEEYIRALIKDVIEWKTVKVDQLMETTGAFLATGMSSPTEEDIKKIITEENISEMLIDIETTYSTPKKVYEIIYLANSKHREHTFDHMNHLAALISLKNSVICHNAALIAYDYDPTSVHHVKLVSFTEDDLVKLVRRRFLHTACLIKKNSIEKIYYHNPKDLLGGVWNIKQEDSIEKADFTLLKYNLVLLFRKSSPDDPGSYINEVATRINGLYRIQGDVILLHEIDTGLYGNLSVREAKRLNVLSYGRMSDRNIRENETIHSNEQAPATFGANTVEEAEARVKEAQKQTAVWNRYVIVEKRMGVWKTDNMKCQYCSKPMTENLIHKCHKCFRTRACSLTCHRDILSHHHSDCVRNS